MMEAARIQEQEQERGSYRSILKSTSLIGGASVVNILLGMVRTKFVAVLLGPIGVGLLGLYTQVTALVAGVSGMGIATSGVRQVAEAVGTGDQQRISRTVVTLRRAAWVTGGLGMLSMIVLAMPISRLTFGNGDHAVPLGLLGITVLLAALSAGESCVLQGTRRIADVARVTIVGSLIATGVSIPCYYAWGMRGVVVALIVAAAGNLGTSWWFARRVPLASVMMSWGESRQEAGALLSLGVSFMGAGLLSTGTTYVIQTLLARRFGVAGLGIYQAAFSVSGALVGFVLGAMATDYYPRLTSVAGDDVSVRRMLNEQAQVSILLALPGLAAMMVLSGPIIQLLYAPDFAAAIPILRWCILGMLGRVLSWPLGFVLLARGNGRMYFATEAVAAALHVGTVVVFTRMWGLDGTGIAFMGLYVVYTALMLILMNRLVGGAWSARTWKLNGLATVLLVALMVNGGLNPEAISRRGIGVLMTAGIAWLCLRHLLRHSGIRMSRFFPPRAAGGR